MVTSEKELDTELSKFLRSFSGNFYAYMRYHWPRIWTNREISIEPYRSWWQKEVANLIFIIEYQGKKKLGKVLIQSLINLKLYENIKLQQYLFLIEITFKKSKWLNKISHLFESIPENFDFRWFNLAKFSQTFDKLNRPKSKLGAVWDSGLRFLRLHYSKKRFLKLFLNFSHARKINSKIYYFNSL